LCEIGEARKITMLHDRARYDGTVRPHHPVICIGCRRIRDLEIPRIDRLLDGHLVLGEFKLLGSSLEIQALCERCSSRQTTRGKRARR
jgi:Fe2+ or Zn2+ uptake regulation protein